MPFHVLLFAETRQSRVCSLCRLCQEGSWRQTGSWLRRRKAHLPPAGFTAMSVSPGTPLHVSEVGRSRRSTWCYTCSFPEPGMLCPLRPGSRPSGCPPRRLPPSITQPFWVRPQPLLTTPPGRSVGPHLQRLSLRSSNLLPQILHFQGPNMCPTPFVRVKHLFHCDLSVLQELDAILYILYMILFDKATGAVSVSWQDPLQHGGNCSRIPALALWSRVMSRTFMHHDCALVWFNSLP